MIELFKTHSIEATFFMNSIFLSNTINEKEFKTFLKDTKIIDKEKLINSEIIQKLIDHGHEIGSHTHSHRTLKDLSEEELRYEINENLKYIYEFGIKPKSFSTPYGMKRLVKNSQIAILNEYFDVICFGEPGLLHKQQKSLIERYPWKVNKSFIYNLTNLRTDTTLFNKLTRRSGLG